VKAEPTPHAAIDARQLEAEHLVQVYGQLAIEPVRGEGVILVTRDGRRIIDLYGGHAVASLGYGHPRLLSALEDQARQMLFQSNAVAMEVRARAANRLAAFAPAGLERVFFVNSGAEANENALRIALKVTGRGKVLGVEHGFHGRSAAAAAVTWGSDKWYGFPRRPFDVEFLPRDDVEQLNRVDSQVAAVIVEPVQGVAGAYDLDLDYLRQLAGACAEAGALLIMDEVQTGVGRLGLPFGADRAGVLPDMLTTAKALAGGFPAGALIMNETLAATLKSGDLGTTFGGGPLAARLIETVIDTIETDNLLDNVVKMSALIRNTCQVGPVIGIQGAGFLLGLRTAIPAVQVRDALLERGILVGTSGDPNVIRLLPPFILQAQHVAQLAAALVEIN
jgi:acetylornithine/N-succinyldiaminopimelate aminotransferase